MVCLIANVMPYVKDLNIASAEIFLKVLDHVLNRVKKNEDYFNCVGSIIEAINYSLWYQDGHNENMRIALSMRRDLIVWIQSLEEKEGGEESEEDVNDDAEL